MVGNLVLREDHPSPEGLGLHRQVHHRAGGRGGVGAGKLHDGAHLDLRVGHAVEDALPDPVDARVGHDR